MEELTTSAESIPNGALDKPFLAVVVFGLCFFLALFVFLAPVRKS
jgi:hypothetical protein